MSVFNAIGKPIVALVLGILAPVILWVGVGSGLYACLKRGRAALSRLCALNSDCPSGFVCVNGRCVREGQT